MGLRRSISLWPIPLSFPCCTPTVNLYSGVIMNARIRTAGLVAICLMATSQLWAQQSYKYVRLGSREDSQVKPSFGIAMMGGGSDLDEAFRWLCKKGNGGDFLILRARGDDDYNSYVNGLCKANSVATLIIPVRSAAQDPAVAEIIRRSEVVFIAGGDQANYIRGWQGTAVEKAINEGVAAGKPIGGTSAGLAVEGEFVYGALGDKPDDKDLSSADVLTNPYFERVTVIRDFLRIALLENLITDSHFVKRDRMGRSLGFLARIMKEDWSSSPREVAVDEKSAVLVEENGKATVVGPARGAYFMKPTRGPETCAEGMPLTFRDITVYRVPKGGHFDLKSWTGSGGVEFSLSVVNGRIESTQPASHIY